MRAQPTLVATVKHAGRYARATSLQVQYDKLPIKALGTTFALDAVSGFYARYTQGGKRHIDPLGKDPVSAYTQFLQIEAQTNWCGRESRHQ